MIITTLWNATPVSAFLPQNGRIQNEITCLPTSPWWAADYGLWNAAIIGGTVGLVCVFLLFALYPFIFNQAARLNLNVNTDISIPQFKRVEESNLHTQYASQISHSHPSKEYLIVNDRRVPVRRK